MKRLSLLFAYSPVCKAPIEEALDPHIPVCLDNLDLMIWCPDYLNIIRQADIGTVQLINQYVTSEKDKN